MSLPDFDSMSIEQITDYRVEKREQMRTLREEIIASKEAYERKLSLRYLGAQMRNDDLEHLSTADARSLMEILRKSPRDGDVVVETDTSELTITGGTPATEVK